MSCADAVVGMMDGAYFVGRKELLDFFNHLLDLNLTKIEQTAPGHIACQVTDLIFPNTINMAKINWEAKTDYEYVQNYKLLQAAFTKHRVQRHVDVDKLIRAKYQDNLEFCQWLKAFYDQAAQPRADYNAAAVREKGKGGKKFNQTMGSGKGRYAGHAYVPNKQTTIATGTGTTLDDRVSRPLRERITENAKSPVRIGSGSGHRGGATGPDTTSALDGDVQHLQKKNAELHKKIADLELQMETLERDRDEIVMEVEKERDFYFGKLRSIEVMLQVHQEQGDAAINEQHSLVDRIFQILYAAAEDNLTVNEQGQVVEAQPLDTSNDGSGVGANLNELLVDNV